LVLTIECCTVVFDYFVLFLWL